MATRTKLNVAMVVASVMMFLNIFSHALGIPLEAQIALEVGVFVPLGLIFFLLKRLKAEGANRGIPRPVPSEEKQTPEIRGRKPLLIVWGGTVIMSLAAPLWLPITGSTLTLRLNFVVGLVTAAIVSCIFLWRLFRRPKLF